MPVLTATHTDPENIGTDLLGNRVAITETANKTYTGTATFQGLVDIETDELTVNSVKVATVWSVTAELLAASVDKWMYVAPRACKVSKVDVITSVIGGTGATVRPRKIVAATVAAPGAAVAGGITEITTAALGLESTVNTMSSGTLSATATDYTFAAGDKLGLDFAGTLTGLVGLLTITFVAV